MNHTTTRSEEEESLSSLACCVHRVSMVTPLQLLWWLNRPMCERTGFYWFRYQILIYLTIFGWLAFLVFYGSNKPNCGRALIPIGLFTQSFYKVKYIHRLTIVYCFHSGLGILESWNSRNIFFIINISSTLWWSLYNVFNNNPPILFGDMY